jgi:hypothetical protein
VRIACASRPGIKDVSDKVLSPSSFTWVNKISNSCDFRLSLGSAAPLYEGPLGIHRSFQMLIEFPSPMRISSCPRSRVGEAGAVEAKCPALKANRKPKADLSVPDVLYMYMDFPSQRGLLTNPCRQVSKLSFFGRNSRYKVTFTSKHPLFGSLLTIARTILLFLI